jgi:UDP-GlcNAc:undecaprenyl-phosphate GlcNAc-1-phosphate transferase
LLSHGWHKRATEMAAIIAGGLGAFFLGWLDDRMELSPARKFSGQLLIALIAAAAGVRITLFVPNLFVNYGITVLWFVTVMNAFNFNDNANGLCGGLSAIGALCFGIFSAISGQYLVGCMAFLVAGSFLGFLPYNFPRARVFLGDSGSHLAGYLLSVLAILPHFYNPHRLHRVAVLLPIFFLIVPLADLACVVMIRWKLGKPFYHGDNNHFSHRLMRGGWSPAKAVLFLWGAAGIAGAIALFWIIRL